jgi:hypothetical protein
MVDRRKFKGTSIYKILQHTIISELDELKDYVTEISSDLKLKQEKLEQDFNKAIEDASDEEQQEIHFFYEDDINKYFKTFPVYTYNPILLTLYGFFENWLKKLCDFDNRRGFSQVKVSDLAGNNYIEKSRRYLNLIAEIDLNRTETQWQKIIEIQKIRNCIAHNDSNIIRNKSVSVEKQELFKILKDDKRIKLDLKKGDFYIQDKEFILEVITLFKDYLTNVTTELSTRKVVARNTTMPFNNVGWGQEKTEELLKSIISGIEMLDMNETRTDEFKDSDLKFNLRGHFKSMAWNVTKLYAFFCDGSWDTKDAEIVVSKKNEGLTELKKIYNG